MPNKTFSSYLEKSSKGKAIKKKNYYYICKYYKKTSLKPLPQRIKLTYKYQQWQKAEKSLF
jgi:hypothetical protein